MRQCHLTGVYSSFDEENSWCDDYTCKELNKAIGRRKRYIEDDCVPNNDILKTINRRLNETISRYIDDIGIEVSAFENKTLV